MADVVKDKMDDKLNVGPDCVVPIRRKSLKFKRGKQKTGEDLTNCAPTTEPAEKKVTKAPRKVLAAVKFMGKPEDEGASGVQSITLPLSSSSAQLSLPSSRKAKTLKNAALLKNQSTSSMDDASAFRMESPLASERAKELREASTTPKKVATVVKRMKKRASGQPTSLAPSGSSSPLSISSPSTAVVTDSASMDSASAREHATEICEASAAVNANSASMDGDLARDRAQTC